MTTNAHATQETNVGSSVQQKNRTSRYKCTFKDRATRVISTILIPYVKKTYKSNDIFNLLLLTLGVRVPRQKLYSPNSFFSTKLKCLTCTYRVYSLLILGCVSVLPIKYLYELCIKYDDGMWLQFTTELLIPIQYVLAVRYFGSRHIQQFYDINKPISTGLLVVNKRTHVRQICVDVQCNDPDASQFEFKQLIKRPCRATIRVVCSLIVMMSSLIFIGSITSNMSVPNNNFYLFYIVSRLFGRCTCVLNTAIFVFVFYKHIKVINVYADVLSLKRWHSSSYDKISIMLVNIVRIRESLRTSTDELKLMFSTTTVNGAAIIGAIAHSKSLQHILLSYDTYVMLGSFLIMQLALFGVIAKLSLAKERIERVTNGSEFAMQFLVRHAKNDQEKSTFESASSLDWWLMTYVLKEPWLDFSVMGIPVHSMAFIKQCMTVSSLLLLLLNSGNASLDVRI